MLRGMREEKQRLMGMLLRLERETPHSLALSAGGRDLCGGDCTRSGGMPCRRPDEMRYSIDALGGDLSKTMERYFGRPILWIQNGKMCIRDSCNTKVNRELSAPMEGSLLRGE